jgi:hypothetical protein
MVDDANAVSDWARQLGRLGGLKGGPARAKALSPKRRKDIARKAVETRWQKVYPYRLTTEEIKGLEKDFGGQETEDYHAAHTLLIMLKGHSDAPIALAWTTGYDIEKIIEWIENLKKNKCFINHKFQFEEGNEESFAIQIVLMVLVMRGMVERVDEDKFGLTKKEGNNGNIVKP